MGIKGIYGEIGPGNRMALSKLAIEKFEESGQPLRIAIDISIWQFQIQSGQGGSNPAIRTLYYRLLRLLSLSVQPLFVFDGPQKPPFKRNKRTGHFGASLPNLLTKQLLKLFGFPFHVAPGEAEAECALLQREGIVDAVLSEDVDTLMFGCGLTFRNWSSEGSRGSRSPTHVSVYDANLIKDSKSRLDREGMILVALMSGGDYITGGIPGCGVKTACEAARAGFGKSLCQLSMSDKSGLDNWRKRLAHEIQTNESRYFRIKHKSLKILDNFPDKEVLSYYTHPVVSSASKIKNLRNNILWDTDIDIPGLRAFVSETFEWKNSIGAKKFIRGLAPVLLVYKLRLRGNRRHSGYGDVILTAMNEMELVRAICGNRTHFSTDGIPELRLVYHPADIVGLDLDAEEDGSEDYGRNGLAPVNSDGLVEAYMSENDESMSRSGSPSKRATPSYDPSKPDKLWVPETIAKIGIPLKVEDYEESLRNPRKFITAKEAVKKAATRSGMPKGAMDKFVKKSKAWVEDANEGVSQTTGRTRSVYDIPSFPPAYPATTLETLPASRPTSEAASLISSRANRTIRSTARAVTSTEHMNVRTVARTRTTTMLKVSSKKTIEDPTNSNPWMLSRTSSAGHTNSSITKYPAQQPRASNPPLTYHQDYNSDLASNMLASPPSSPPLPLTPLSQKQACSLQLDSQTDEEPLGAIEICSTGEQGDQYLHTPSGIERDTGLQPTGKQRSPISQSINCSPALPQPRSCSTKPLTPENVSRKIDFLSSALRALALSVSLSSVQELPLSLDSSENDRIIQREIITLSSCPNTPRSRLEGSTKELSRLEGQNLKGGIGKKYILLRKSLNGAWKEADESELIKGRSRAWRHSQVEFLDLTAD